MIFTFKLLTYAKQNCLKENTFHENIFGVK